MACSDGSHNSAKNDRATETPIGHRIIEGNTASSALTLYFISPIDGPLTYNTFNITAAEKSDFEPIAGTLQAEKGKEYALDVIVYGDTKIEGNETFGINFKDANNESVSSIIGQIENDDFPTVTSNSPLVLEGDTGTATLIFTFTLSEAVVDDYAIAIASLPESAITDKSQIDTKNFATPDIDYLPINETLTFKQGELEKQIEVTIYSDNIIEHDEAIVLNVVRDLAPSQYAIGTIRTDETPDSNGFQLNINIQDTNLLGGITEGTSHNPEQLTWKKVNYEVQVIQPQNIQQDQTLIFTLLTLEQAKQQYNVTYLDSEYINLFDSPDACFTYTQTDTHIECEPTYQYVLKENETSFIVPVYIKEDITRELDETYIIDLSNDQNVHFNNVESKIKNDDSEGLQIKVDGQFIDFKTFTENGSIYELKEPNGNSEAELNNITFRLNNGLDIKYDIDYELGKYDKKRSARNGEYAYATDNHTLSFLIGAASPQDVNIGLILKSDSVYDGDKYLTLTLKETNLAPLIIKIVDSDYPKLEGTTTYDNTNLTEETNGFAHIQLLEQENADHTHTTGNDRQYIYTIKTNDGIPLLSDIKYQVELLTDGINGAEDVDQSNEPNVCSSVNRTSKIDLADISPEQADVVISHNNNTNNEVNINTSGEITLLEGSNSYDLKITVKNDPTIECQEAFKIKISPVDDQSITAAAQTFVISDTDKALITVQSWQTAETDTTTKTQNFQFNANKKVNAVLTPILTGQGLNCNADDLNPPTGAATTVNFTPDSLTPTFPIYIKGDTTVEPNEACTLTAGVIDAELAKLIEVQYLDSNGVVIEDATHATGLIENDDKLNITILNNLDINEPLDDSAPNSLVQISLDKEIASNAGDIKLGISADECVDTADIDCVESTDFSLVEEFYIKAAGNPDINTDLSISAVSDNEIENIERINISIDNLSNNYIQSVIPSDVSRNIIDQDVVTLTLEETTSVISTTVGEGSELTFTLENDMNIAGGIPAQALSINADGLESTDYSITLPANNAGYIRLVNGVYYYTVPADGIPAGSTTSFTVNILEDALVEVDEQLTFSVSIPAPVDPNARAYYKMSNPNTLVTKTITSSEIAQITLVETPSTSTEVTEGNTLTFTLTNNIAIDAGITNQPLNILISGVSPTDYSLTLVPAQGITNNPDANYTHLYTIPAGGLGEGTVRTFTLNILEDSLVEMDESLTLTVSTSGGNEIIAVSSSGNPLSTIIKDAAASIVSLTLEETTSGISTTVAENSELTFTLENDMNIAGGIPAQALSINADGLESTDYSITLPANNAGYIRLVNGVYYYTVPADGIPAGSTTSFTVNILEDALVEVDEQLTFSVSIPAPVDPNARAYYKMSNPNTLVTKTITSSEIAQITLVETPSTSTEVTEGNTLTFTLTNNIAIDAGITNQPLNILISGVSPTDYSLTLVPAQGITNNPDANYTHLYTIPAGGLSAGTARTFSLNILEDSLVEMNESLTLTVSTSVGNEIIDVSSSGNPISKTIQDDVANPNNIVTLTLSEIAGPTSNAVSEGTDLTFKLENDKSIAAGVPFQVLNLSVTGIEASDYTISVPEFGLIDMDDQGDTDKANDIFTYVVPATGIDLNTAAEFTLTINDDDLVEIPETLSLSVTISEPSPGARAYYQMVDTNASISKIINSVETAVLTLAENPSTVGDVNVVEGNTLTYTLTNDIAIEGSVGDQVFEMNIPAPVINRSDYEISLRDGLTLNAGVDGTLYTADDTITYTVPSAGVMANTSRTFDIVIIEDNLIETNEALDLSITTNNSAYLSTNGGANSSSKTIQDDITNTNNIVTLTLSEVANPILDTVNEGTTLTFKLENDMLISTGLPNQVLNFNVTGVEASDYTISVPEFGLIDMDDQGDTDKANDIFTYVVPATGIDLNTAAEFTLTINDDDLVEIPETLSLSVTISEPSPGTRAYYQMADTNVPISKTINSTETAVLTLAENPVTPDDVNVVEGNTLTYTLTNNIAIEGSVGDQVFEMNIPAPVINRSDYEISLRDGLTLNAGVDGTLYTADDTITYTVPSAGVMANTSRTFDIVIIEDNLIETNEALDLSITTNNSAYLSTNGGANSSSKTIQDDITNTNNIVTLTLSEVANPILDTVNEGTDLTFKLENDKPVATGVLPQILNFNVTGVEETDYTITPTNDLTDNGDGTFTYNIPDKSTDPDAAAVFTLTINDDDLVEIPETLELSVTITPPATGRAYYQMAPSNAPVAKTITSTETAVLTLAENPVTPDDVNVVEGNTLTYTLTNNIAIEGSVGDQVFEMNIPAPVINRSDYEISLRDGLTLNAGVDGTLYTADDTITYTVPSAGVMANTSRTFDIVIIEDNLIETNEALDLSITTNNSAYLSTNGGANSSSKTIQDDITNTNNIVTLTLSEVANPILDTVNEGTDLTFKLENDKPVATGVLPQILNFSVTGVEGSDYTITPTNDLTDNGDGTFTYNIPDKSVNPDAAAEFTLTINDDDLIELPETLSLSVTISAPSDPDARAYYKMNDSNPAITKTIINNDFIYVYLTDDTNPLEEPSTVNIVASRVYWTGGTFEQGLTMAEDLTITIGVSGDATSGADYTLSAISAPLIPAMTTPDTPIIVTSDNAELITLKPDALIEGDEKLIITLGISGGNPDNSYIKFSNQVSDTIKSEYTYTIKDNESDRLVFSAEYYLDGAPVDQLTEEGEIKIKVCIPTGLSLPGSPTVFGMGYVVTHSEFTENNTFKATEDANFSSVNSTLPIDLSSGFEPDGCKVVDFLSILEIGNQNKFFDLEFTTGDPRCNGNCIDELTNQIIFNDDFTTIADTGLDQCVRSRNWYRYSVSCGQVANSNYYKQDADTTDFYPNLAFNFISYQSTLDGGDGITKIAIEKSDNTAHYCLQDNNTGFIWSNSSGPTTQGSIEGITTNQACNIEDVSGGPQWNLPSVQELLTILDLNPISSLKAFVYDNSSANIYETTNKLGLLKEGSNLSTTSLYWSNNSCTVEAEAGETVDGMLAVDFHLGEVICTPKTDSAHTIYVYR